MCDYVPSAVNIAAVVLSVKHPTVECAVDYCYDILLCLCSRGGARAGGAATLAIQRLPAGAQRVPAAATQTAQVPLHSHVTPPGRQRPVENGGGGEQRRGKIMTKSETLFLFVLLFEGLILRDAVAEENVTRLLHQLDDVVEQ